MLNTLRGVAGSLVGRLRGEGGATAVEYGLAVMLIAVVVIVGAFAFGGSTNDLFDCANRSVADSASRC